MKTRATLPAAALLLATPLSAYAEIPHITLLYSFGGAAAGGFVGALLACWLCKRMSSKKDKDR